MKSEEMNHNDYMLWNAQDAFLFIWSWLFISNEGHFGKMDVD